MSLVMALKVRVAELLSRPAVGRVVGAVLRDRIPIRGCVIDTRDGGIAPAVKAMLLFRLYESAEIRFVQRLLRTDLDVVELGGCLGVVSSQIARRLQRGRRLVTVEPNPRLGEVIRRNVLANAPDALLTVVSAAIDYSADGPQTTLALGEANIDSALATGAETRPSVRVPATTLGRVLADHGMDEFVLVSDIEGAEAGMLQRDGDSLAKCKQVLIELHPTTFEGRPVSVEDMLAGLRRLGFRQVESYGPVFAFRRV